MGSFAQILVCGLSFASSALAVWLVRRHAVERQLLDIPNDRSSHTQPTPRGGGLGIVLVVAIVGGVTTIVWTPARLTVFWACLVALLGVAAVGWIDDRRGLGVRVRLMVHLLSGSAVAQLAVAEASATRTFSAAVALMWLCWLLWTASAINVVNFMDGIDGLVASQGAIAMGSIAWLAPASGLARPFGLLVGAACVGFLVWNWPPARIFLGDVGSGSLGFLLAVAGALLFREVDLDPVRIYLPLFPLFLDSAWTMLRRLRNRERLTVAHRSHLYQRLANGPWGHGRVTLVFVVAALAGALVATVDNAASRWVLTGAYAVLVLLLGMSLDRRAPFVWRARASGVSKPERTGAVSFTKSRGDPT